MHRLPMTLLLPVLLLCGCAENPPRIDRSRPPVDPAVPLAIEPLALFDQLPYTRAFHGDFADGQRLLVGETFELVPSSQPGTDRCTEGALYCVGALFAYMAIPIVVIPTAIVALPFIAAKEKKDREAAAAAAAAQSAADSESGAQSSPGIEPEPPVVAEVPAAVSSSPEERAKWLADVVLEGQWSTSLDGAYIAALYESLGWTPPVPVDTAGQAGSPAADAKQLRAGISKVILLEETTGAQTLFVCAQFLLQQGSELFRYFETCQSNPFALPAPRESPASADALKSALVDVAMAVSIRQAKALTGQLEFAQRRL